jgi:hypothetical protein
MFGFVKNFFRRKCLRRYCSDITTGIRPLKDLHSAVAFIDVEDISFDICKESILAFFREKGIKGDIFFFDFRKISNEERLITSIKTTVLKKDLNWFGKPVREKIALMSDKSPDLFISLINSSDFPICFMASCSHAKFKIGRRQLPGNVFDMVISDPGNRVLSQAESFEAMKSYLDKIK